jgi:hypothetical protein
MADGWVKLHRQIVTNDLWLSEPFTRAQAWVDLILLANHGNGVVRRRGIKINVQRGQVGVSQDSLAERWRWSKNKVRRFLKELISDGQISLETELKNIAVSTLITITNYEFYQGSETEDETEEKPKIKLKTALEQEEEEKEEEKEVKTSSPSGDEAGGKFYLTRKKKKLAGKRLETFERFWIAFGYKSGKAEAADAWLEIPTLTDAIVEQIVSAAKAECERRPDLIANGKTPKMAQGWLSGRRWEDEEASGIEQNKGTWKTGIFAGVV